MFRGINSVNVDAKGRMAITSRYRDQLQNDTAANKKNRKNNQLVVTIDTEAKCLLLYPLAAWEEIERKVSALSSFNKATRRIQRLLIGHATEVDVDGSGRILLPPLLRDYAGLTKAVVLVGQAKKFEIWDETEWNNHRKNWLSEGPDENAEIPDEMQSLSL